MIEIDKITFNFPSGFEQRAEHIARLMIYSLGQSRLTKKISLAQVTLPTMKVNPEQSNEKIAQQLVNSLLVTLTGTHSPVKSPVHSPDKTKSV